MRGRRGGQVCKYQITAVIQGEQCGAFGPGDTTVRGLSAQGEVVGSYVCGLSDAVPFYWSQDAGFVILDTPDWFSGASSARGISDEGTIVGSFTKEIVGTRAFHYKDGVWTELPPVDPESGWSRAQAVSPDGRYVVGWRSITSEINPFNAFIWDAKTAEFTDLGVINGPNSEAVDISSSGYVVGWTGASSIATGDSPFVYFDGKLDIPGPAPGALNSFADAVNSLGQAFCTSRMSSNPTTGVPSVYANGVWTEFPGLEGYAMTTANDLNDQGQAAGAGTVSLQGLPAVRACVWLDGVVYDLNDLIPPNTGVFLRSAVKINNAGQILCNGDDPNGEDVGLLLTPISTDPADFNADCQVGATDLQVLLSAWGQANGSAADLDDDGSVGVFDLAILLASWG